jgi:hypothetical protein
MMKQSLPKAQVSACESSSQTDEWLEVYDDKCRRVGSQEERRVMTAPIPLSGFSSSLARFGSGLFEVVLLDDIAAAFLFSLSSRDSLI